MQAMEFSNRIGFCSFLFFLFFYFWPVIGGWFLNISGRLIWPSGVFHRPFIYVPCVICPIITGHYLSGSIINLALRPHKKILFKGWAFVPILCTETLIDLILHP